MLPGAYGKVYRGILDDISHVAVKMLPSGQLNQRQVDAFLNEVGTSLAAVAHMLDPNAAHKSVES